MPTEFNPYQPPAAHEEVPIREEGSAVLATRWARLGASMIDGLIALAVFVPLQYAMGIYDNFPKVQPFTVIETAGWAVASLVFWVLVHGRSLSTRSQTLGKRFVGIQVMNVNDGRPASFNKLVFARYLPTDLVAHVPVIGSFLSVIDVLFIFRRDRRCIHDHIAGTMVVEYRPQP